MIVECLPILLPVGSTRAFTEQQHCSPGPLFSTLPLCWKVFECHQHTTSHQPWVAVLFIDVHAVWQTAAPVTTATTMVTVVVTVSDRGPRDVKYIPWNLEARTSANPFLLHHQTTTSQDEVDSYSHIVTQASNPPLQTSSRQQKRRNAR